MVLGLIPVEMETRLQGGQRERVNCIVEHPNVPVSGTSMNWSKVG